jgi:polysaccharide export outer membrane protein
MKFPVAAAGFAALCSLPAVRPLEAQLPTASETSVLRVGDILRIKVWPDSSLGGEYPVEETGLVYLPVIGEYHAAGRPISVIRQDLRTGYSRELKLPVVNVTPLFRVSVLGAVQKPGLYYADPTNTWFDLISDAGGFTSTADRNDLRILRDGQTLRVNAAQAELESGGPLNVPVQSGDRILVPAHTFSWQTPVAILQTLLIMASAVYQFTR